MQVNRWNEPNLPNPAMLRFWLSNEGYAVYQWCDMPNAIRPMHKHDKDQSHWIVSGSLEVRLSTTGEIYTLETGDRDFIPANTFYSLRVIGEDSVMFLVGEKL